ncbi:MAG TPA: DMT family transporter [Solirubrobacteraceae bacterium]
MAIALSLVSALLFALGTVLQQRAGASAPSAGAHSGLILRMARRPVWLAGIAADGLGFVAQAAALGTGRLSLVQPLLVVSVVFALPLGVRLSGQRVGRHEIAAAALVVLALAAFLVLASPSGGRNGATLSAWLLVGVVAAAACTPLALLGHRGPAPRRAALLGTAAGLLFALSAALTKAVVHELDTGLIQVLSSWELYALIGIGYVSMTLNQLALNTGSLAATMATSSASDPIASVVLGLALFHESLHLTGLRAVGVLTAFALALLGTVVLAESQEQTSPQASG